MSQTQRTSAASASLLNRFIDIQKSLQQEIIGQYQLIERLLIALLADGHLLVEGPPGLAKTRAINLLGELIEADFQRIQFTPDLLPADLTGTEIFRPQTGDFKFEAGPIFHNLILADEINRAPAKVQSALLEAMAERQVTIGGTTHKLKGLFLVMATQNPIEQEGTYPLPEAQLDRFLMHVNVGYPDAETEQQILQLVRSETMGVEQEKITKLSQKLIMQARQDVLKMHMTEPVEQYLVQLILATRQPKAYGDDLANWIEFGSSPRGTLALDRCARAKAWLQGRDFVTPDDIQHVAFDVLRHRILINYTAEAEGITADYIVNKIIERVPVP